jgi:aspartyl/asparaginyl-tRNA synthetase
VNRLLNLGNTHIEGVQLTGWIQSVRKQKRWTFLVITDGSSSQTVQAVASASDLELTTGLVSLRAH